METRSRARYDEEEPQNPSTATSTQPDLATLLSSLLLASPSPRLPTYSGESQECPAAFITKMRKALVQRRVPEEDWTATAATQLQGAAAAWFQGRNEECSLDHFEFQLKERFDNCQVRAAISAELFSQLQSHNETAVDFIWRKARLFRRLHPQMPEDQQVAVIFEQLLPDLQLHACYGPRPPTVDALAAAISDIERRLQKRDAADKKPKTQSVPRARDVPLPPSAPARPRQEPAARPPPKCHYCPDLHFHRDCPVLRQRQGNWREAEVTRRN